MIIAHPPLPDIDWAFAEYRTNAHVHDFHPYPARFIPQIPATLITHLSQPGETVLDPFCGGGTTLVEASLLGRNAVGNDLNPVGVLVSKVKTTPLSAQRLASLDPWLEGIERDRSESMGQFTLFHATDLDAEKQTLAPFVPDIPNMDRWFTPDAKAELGGLVARILQLADPDLQDFCRVALSAILLKASNQDGETRYVYRAKGVKAGETTALFQRKLTDMRVRMADYVGLREQGSYVSVRAQCADSRELPGIAARSVHLAVTSPPYPNAFDYHLYHRFRLFWLGFDPVAMGRREIGSHLNYQRNGENMVAYARDMAVCLVRVNKALAPDRYFCIVIGDSVFKGQVVKNDEVLADLAEQNGFVLEQTIKRSLPSTRRSFAAPARRLKEESILVLRKVSEVDG